MDIPGRILAFVPTRNGQLPAQGRVGVERGLSAESGGRVGGSSAVKAGKWRWGWGLLRGVSVERAKKRPPPISTRLE